MNPKSRITYIILFVLFLQATTKIYSATFNVTVNTDNLAGGAGMLRQAIMDINASALAGPHTINFSGMTNTTAGQTIALVGNLPALTKPTIIDGFTAPGYSSPTPKLWITGASNIFSFTNTGANGSTIRGIIMSGTTSYAILLNGMTNITIQGCWIGLDNTGAIPGGAPSNKVQNHGIFVNNCNTVTIGGTTAAQRNTISGTNLSGISIESASTNITIIGNYIGLDPTGAAARANVSHGINAVSVSNLIIGGTSATNRNVISGNTASGINLDGVTTATIAGNYIGTNPSGTAAIANGVNGVNVLNSSSGITVGGTTSGARNVISGNANTGINVDNLSHGTVIKANYVGTNAAGTAAIANLGHGIFINNSNNCVIGGSNSIERNIVSGNGNGAGENGISITNASGPIIKGNFIGTAYTGLTALANYDSGLSFTNVTAATLGGASFMDRNVISGNGTGGGKFGVYSDNLDNSTITGNFVGVDSTGNAGLGNNATGLYISNASDNNTWTNNVTGKNGLMGFELISSTGNTFYGNKFGLGYNGTSNVGNLSQGLRIGTGSNSNTIGGSAAGQRNYISGNRNNAFIIDQNSNNNIVKGNYVGTDVTGLSIVSNNAIGIFVFENSNGNQIGGTAAGEGNLVCCSETNGGINVQVSSNNTIYGNIVGLDANLSRTAGFGNATGGVNIGSHADGYSTVATNNIIGGIAAGQKNIIANNTGAGVTFNYWGAGTSQFNSAIGNSIYCNSGAGIAFSGTPLQEGVVAPTITTRTLTGVSGTGTTGNTIHVYWNSTADGGIKCDCEAEIYLGTTTVAAGVWALTFTTPFTSMADVNTVTATQTTTNKSTSVLSTCPSNPLPVNWINFDAKSGSNVTVLAWSTGEEKNNKYFEIQKSNDGKAFTDIGSISGQGNSSTIKNYEFIDPRPYEGINYYRIKQIDINGSYSYSEIKTIDNGSNDYDLAVWPNPSVGLINYSVNTIHPFTVEVYNSIGNSILTQTINPSNVNSVHQLDLSNMASGVYTIKVIEEGAIRYSQVTKY